jgi:hypothetical protein
MSWGTIRSSVPTGIAKPTPELCPVRLAIAVVIPISKLPESSSGPPEFPGLIAASVCIIDLIVLPARVGSDLFKLEMIPVVRVRSRPNGFPIAKTF